VPEAYLRDRHWPMPFHPAVEGAILQLAPLLHRLGRSSLVNSYLIEDAAGITIIDAGPPGHWKDLGRELTAMGRSFADIRALLLTHGDVDHVGFAERLRRDHTVPVYVGEGDAAEARGEVKKPPAARDPKRSWPWSGSWPSGWDVADSGPRRSGRSCRSALPRRSMCRAHPR
jgi:glyoxylase-like metal-dependent hydrolase (beta-lactamase superfamily II)